jgi:thiamine pyrophosphate-dependent acetolactate synthase large subunit-like protein
MKISGNELFGRALKKQGADTLFFIMGGPINDAALACQTHGVKLIDVRHEQAAAMMAQAYSRVRGVPGLCMGASGPGTINLSTGLANALIDCAPVVAFGGSSSLKEIGTGSFQEIDQVAVMKPITKYADRVLEARRIPEYIDRAFQIAMSGKPGPVFLDLPADVLYQQVEEESVEWPVDKNNLQITRAAPSHDALRALRELLKKSTRPLVLTGSGILWSQASKQLQDFIETTGIPFYTTPQGRGVIPEDHEGFFGHSRSKALKEADLIIFIGTRLNFVFGYGKPPRISASTQLVRIDNDPQELAGQSHVHLKIFSDAKEALVQINSLVKKDDLFKKYASWRDALRAEDEARSKKFELQISNDAMPIHPLRLCKEIRDFIQRDTILVVDGQEILNYGRQTIPSFLPAHRLNSGPFGTMGVGLPFGVGAKAAMPQKQVVVLHGDGSFGLNAMEVDTAIRHQLPILIIISLNGGWTADPQQNKPGRNLGYTRFDKMVEVLGGYGEYVEKPEDIRPALERASVEVSKGRVALVNVVTDWKARAATAAFTTYQT